MADIGEISPPEPYGKTATAGFLPPEYRRSIILFCLTIFFFWVGLYLYVPILPVYAQSLGANLSMVGVVIASYALPQLLFRIPIGIWFDALGRKKPLVAGGIIIAFIGALGLGLASNPWLLSLARATTGLGAAAWVTFTVFFAAYYPRESTGRAIGVINFVRGTALVTATLGGGVVAEVWGSGHTFFGGALLGIVALFTLLVATEPMMRQAETTSWHSFTQVATQPLLLTASFMAVLLLFATFTGIFGFIPIYAVKIGASSADLGIITTIVVGSAALVSLAVPYMSERWGTRYTIVLGAALIGSALLSVPFIHSINMLKAVQIAHGLGRGILGTTTMTLSIQAVDPQQRATAMGVYQATYSIGMLFGPLVSGFLADSQGLTSIFYLSASLCLVIAGMAFLPVLRKY